MNTTTEEVKIALEKLAADRKENWQAWISRIEKLSSFMGVRSNESLEDITIEEIASQGFTQAESEAIMFVLSELARPSEDELDSWFHVNFGSKTA